MKIKRIIILFFVFGIAAVTFTLVNGNQVQASSGTKNISVSIDFDYGEFRPVNIHLYRHQQGQENFEVILTSQATQPTLTFSQLELYGDEGEYNYEVVQDQIPGYETTYEQIGNQINITNKLVMNGQLEFPDAKIDLHNGANLVVGNYPDFEIESTLSTPGGETVEIVNYVNSNGEVIINGDIFYQVCEPGLYFLTLNQKSRDYQNFSFDESRYTVAYQVEYDGSPDLKVQQRVIRKDGQIVSAISYLNVYNSSITRVELEPVVAISGLKPVAEQFKIAVFDLLPFGEFLNSEMDIDYPATDSCNFGIKMYPDTEYAVKIRQVPNESAYYLYDQREFTVKIVTDSYGIPTMDINSNGEIRRKIEFENRYEPVPLNSRIMIKKEVDGGAPDKNLSFAFELCQIDAVGAKTIKNKNLTIETKGSANETGFFELEFSQPGVYHFSINEVAGDIPEYSYDDSVYRVEAVVIDCEGFLAVNYQYYKNNIRTDSIAFKNLHITNNNSVIVDTSDNISYIYEDILLGLGTLTVTFFVYKKIKAVT